MLAKVGIQAIFLDSRFRGNDDRLPERYKDDGLGTFILNAGIQPLQKVVSQRIELVTAFRV